MKVAVYASESLPLRFILTPECMQPSADCVHQFGPLFMRGTLGITEDLLTAISYNVEGFAGEFEFVVDDEFSTRYVEALLEAPVCAGRPAGPLSDQPIPGESGS